MGGKITSTPLRLGLRQLINMQPFWGALALQMGFKQKDSIETLETNGKEIRYNRSFCDSLSVGLATFVIAHEVSHPFLGHMERPFQPTNFHSGVTFGRTKDGKVFHYHPQVYNAAGDYVINLMLRGAGFQLWPKALVDDKYTKWTTEQVYKDICPPIIPTACLSCGGSGQQAGDSGDSPCPSCEGTGEAPDTKLPTTDPICGNDLSPDGPAEDFNQAEFNEMVQKAAAIAKAQGKMPAGIEETIKEATEPQYPVYMLLERYVDDAIRDDDDSWKRPHRDFMSRGIIMPSPYSEAVSRVELVYDTSGSVPDADLSRFHRVGGDIIRRLKPACLAVSMVDAKLHSRVEIRKASDWPSQIKCTGRGGTNFNPIFEELRNKRIRPSVLVYLTDTYGSFPTKPPGYPVLWVSTEKGRTAPFGTTIYFNG